MAKTKKLVSRHSPEELECFFDEVATIECNVEGCQESDSTFDHYNPAEYFFEQGWRATASKCYCPKHAKQKLKNP